MFDDNILNETLVPETPFGHVSYARNANHPYRDFFVTASALAQYAVYDGGIAIKNFLMQAKGIRDNNQWNLYLSQNNNTILIGTEDVQRTSPN